MRNSCAWSPGGAKTFRNKSGMIFETFGSNMQNPSERICRIYHADAGKIFNQVDQAGAEDLLFSYDCGTGRGKELHKYGVKPHSYVALHLFNTQWNKETPYDCKHLASLPIVDLAVHPEWKAMAKIIKNNHERYFIGKKTRHSFNYGKKAASFRFDVLKESEGKIVLSLMESEIFEAIYLGIFPEIKSLQMEIEKEVKETRTLRNHFGFPMFFGGKLTDKVIREAIAWKFQSTVGVIATNAFCNMQYYVEDNHLDWDVLNNKHDSILCQSPIEEVDECDKKMKEYLEVDLVSKHGEPFRMKTESTRGKNWGKYNETTNPEGMKDV